MHIYQNTELLGMDIDELSRYVLSLGEPEFRGRQIYKWIYQKDNSSFYNMSDLPKNVREKLDEKASISFPRFVKQRVSIDGTRKFLLELNDKKRVETVLIPQTNEKKRYSICLSTQVGCPLGCKFCATGASGFVRNLHSFEIIGQLLTSRRELRRRLKVDNTENLITNVVFMGMGEPMLNYDALIKAIHIINDRKGINIGQRHITISTSGEVKGIKKLMQEDLQVTLAISLHACNNELRNELIPLNRKYPLEQLFEVLRRYIEKTGRRVTFEYILLDEVNNFKKDADNLIKLVKPLLANVNLIPYNEVEGLEFKRPSLYKIKQFYQYLKDNGINVTLREEHGTDIEAACGQLAAKTERRYYSRLSQKI